MADVQATADRLALFLAARGEFAMWNAKRITVQGNVRTEIVVTEDGRETYRPAVFMYGHENELGTMKEGDQVTFRGILYDVDGVEFDRAGGVTARLRGPAPVR